MRLKCCSCAALGVLVCALAWSVDFSGLPVVGDAAPREGERFSFVIVGDKTSGGEGKWPIFDRAVDAVNLLKPDFAITVGDQIPGHMQERALWDAEWKEYLEHARRLEMPLLLAPGNHDIANTECYGFWKEDWGPTYYSFDYKKCHFLVLNTEEERFDGRGPIWRKMMTFAEEDLAAHQDSVHTFVFFHKPMWDDPRFAADWARLEKALAGRRYTAVAGHEHYLMTERRDDDLLVVQSATGGGLGEESVVKEYGGFHSVGYVTVDGDEVTYAVVEPEGGVWPVDIAPASFRKAIEGKLVQLDAELPEGMNTAVVTVRARARLSNVLSEPIEMEVHVEEAEANGWHLESALTPRRLEPGATAELPLVFRVPREKLPAVPAVTWRVKYRGQWIPNNAMPMVQENVVPVYPASCMKDAREWQLAGPFPLGELDTKDLRANTCLFERFGPEDGYVADRVYGDNLKWYPADGLERGLLNFNALMGTKDLALGYALCGVYSPRAQLTHGLVYADNYAQVVLNGELLEVGQTFGGPGGFVYAPLALREGWNTLIVKLINNRGDWFLRVLVADPEGNLRFARVPEEGR
jgi:hypothetical protein